MLSSNHTSWYLSKRCNNLDPHKNSHQDIYSIFIHDCQNLEVTKMFSNDKQTVVYPDNGILFSTNEKWALKPWKDMEEL